MTEIVGRDFVIIEHVENCTGFVIKKQVETRMVTRNSATGMTISEQRRQIVVSRKPSVPVLMDDHNNGVLGFLHQPGQPRGVEPLKDPNL